MNIVYVVTRTGVLPEAVSAEMRRLHLCATVIPVQCAVETVKQLRATVGYYVPGRVYLLNGPPAVDPAEPLPPFGGWIHIAGDGQPRIYQWHWGSGKDARPHVTISPGRSAAAA